VLRVTVALVWIKARALGGIDEFHGNLRSGHFWPLSGGEP
jgi:hypothetical protein